MSSDLKWIILKNHEILGPFTTSQIITSIYEGKYRPNDQVSMRANDSATAVSDDSGSNSYFLNWRKLAEVSEFAIFRGNQEDTLVNDTQDDCTDPGDGYTEPTIDDTKVIDFSYNNSEAGRVSRDGHYQVSSKKTRLIVNTILVSAAVILLSLAVYKRMVKISNEDKDWYNVGLSQKKIGNYNNAVTSLKEAYKNTPSDIDVAFNYAEVLIERGQLNRTSEVLHKITAAGAEQRKLNLLGIINLKRKNLHEAKSLFNKALDIDPSYTPALINSGIANLHAFQYTNSHSKFELAYRSGSRDPILIMSKFLATVKLFEQTKNPTLLQYMKRVLASALNAQTGYRIHYHLALSYLEILLGNTKAAEKWFANIIILDADLEPSDFVYNLEIFRDHLSWDTMYSLSAEFYDSLTDEPRIEAIKGILLLKSKKYDKAESTLSNAILRNSEDIGIRLLYAYLKMKLGVLSEAKANIDFALHADHPLLVLIKSKLCDESQENCPSLFEEMSQTDHYKLQGITGLAEHFISAKQYSKASSLVNTGLEASDSYIPLLILNQKLESISKSPTRVEYPPK